ncbi:DNA repair helicase XPB [Thermospira aquatica]|uniref:DNA 3'-5' helicase n=1 Tax=Thermospira aquatica TaxID=2828656 RepID=A0AAX3BCU0_9SPIR|nr:DNA repair helicase XPB [Thermospira aquatica]URA10108.1 helicase-associated domain-containing protein [Thermospira aquatica]
MMRTGALTIQTNGTILLDTHHKDFEMVQKYLFAFAELTKTLEHVHFYRITPISLWNAAANKFPLSQIIHTLEDFSRYPVPKPVMEFIQQHYNRYGEVIFHRWQDQLFIEVKNAGLKEDLIRYLKDFQLNEREGGFLASFSDRGLIKATLIKHLIPVQDLAGYERGEKIPFTLRKVTRSGSEFALRFYQAEAAYLFSQWKEGSGVIVLPCGAGKTIVGMAVMSDIQENTLIIATNLEALHQWKRELLDKTTLTEDDIGEYTAQTKTIKPITLTTYYMLIHRKSNSEERHIDILTQHQWGLIIYDEVHILPAPIFRMTTAIQSKRRLGLTATLVREDNREGEVFSLIGPKIYEYGWKTLEQEGWIATARCYEIRVPLSNEDFETYLNSSHRLRFRIASENKNKLDVLSHLLTRFSDQSILIIGHFLDQLQAISEFFSIPLITGQTPSEERERLYDAFRRRELTALIISRVGNFSIDLPGANVAIQVSGIFGSRQEEAQRLGRILRPQAQDVHFFTIVSQNTIEEEFAKRRQMFLIEKGYTYEVLYFTPKSKTLIQEVTLP